MFPDLGLKFKNLTFKVVTNNWWGRTTEAYLYIKVIFYEYGHASIDFFQKYLKISSKHRIFWVLRKQRWKVLAFALKEGGCSRMCVWVGVACAMAICVKAMESSSDTSILLRHKGGSSGGAVSSMWAEEREDWEHLTWMSFGCFPPGTEHPWAQLEAQSWDKGHWKPRGEVGRRKQTWELLMRQNGRVANDLICQFRKNQSHCNC